MTKHCIVCNGSVADSIYPGIVKCQDCGYIYADLDMDQKEFEKLYNSGYFAGEEYLDYLADKAVIQRNFVDRLQTLKQFVDPIQHRSLMEVGSAYGFFLELAAKEFDHVVGIDVTSEGVKHSREVLGLNARCADLESWDFEGREFDVACMWDTIEHLRSPDKYLKRIAEHMPEGGLLTITTGDIDSWVARWRKNRWRLIHPPTHAHYFSKISMTRLLDFYGFEVVHFEHCGFYRSVDNIAYNLLVLRSKFPWIYKLLKSTSLTSWDLYTNLYDIMYVIARRR